jgi:predicted O-methyltransferase YrrM
VKKYVRNPQETIDSGFVTEMRAALAANKKILNYTDLGSGKLVKRSVSAIYKRSSKSPKQLNLLFRLVKTLQPNACVEIGTSLGLSSLAMSMATDNPIATFEGVEAIADIAEQNFESALKSNITLYKGNFNDSLPQYLEQKNSIEFFYFDGNHYFKPTLQYFEWALEKANERSILVFDDINWSNEMQKAWKEIKKHPRVALTLDLFHVGIVVLNDDFGKGNYSILY